MATTLAVSFIFGRYHATPWGRHVNEGAVELPPSPWRLLRALYSVWKTRTPDLDAATVTSLLSRLAEPPTFYVPPFRLSHTRHYYPKGKYGSGGDTDLTLDAFASFAPNAELGIQWPFDLEPEQHKTLDRLASSLPYLGRADSVCEARVANRWSPPDEWRRTAPVGVDESSSEPDTMRTSSLDVVPVLCATTPLDLQSLVARPVDVRSEKLLFPQGTQFVNYARPVEGAERTVPATRPRVPTGAIRYSILNRVPPSITDMVTLTDLLRQSVLSKLTQEHPAYWWFAGKNSEGNPLEGHRHPHYLALPDRQRKVSELAIWLPDADVCDDNILRLLSGIRTLRNSEDRVAIRMHGYGPASEILSEYIGPAVKWTSATPFVPTGHRKGQWETFVQRRVLRELKYRNVLPDDAEVTFLGSPGVRVSPRRPYQPGVHVPTPTWLQLEFRQPVRGPIVLGRLAHFGLGLFKAEP